MSGADKKSQASDGSAAIKPRTVRCPACGGPSVYAPENPFRPFCSQRCKVQDLGAWASERFRVEAGQEPASSDQGADAARF